MKTITLSPEEIIVFKHKALEWAVSFETACYFDSNSYTDPYSAFDILIAAGSIRELESSSNQENPFDQLSKFLKPQRWALGFLSYDLKNGIEDLQSSNPDSLQFPELFFFEPQHLIQIKGSVITIRSEYEDEELLEQILSTTTNQESLNESTVNIKSRFSFDEYCSTVESIKENILRGDIYEMNLCQEFYSEHTSINPLKTFKKLNDLSPTPFSSFLKLRDKYVISATPERFLCKRGSKLISQPIKGTARRGATKQEDEQLKTCLRNDEKEQSENVMIVDLVRNDLTRCSTPASVKVEELFGIYSFQQVHQMISTVVSEANPELDNAAIIKETFPMGSMTGAPKLSAMKLIEKYERSKRGVFSGAAGYFSPEGDFDFNVIIRTILYNESSKYLSFQVGSAITYASDATKEYEECLVKAEAILKVLSV